MRAFFSDCTRMEIIKAENSDHLVLSEIAFLGKSFWCYSPKQLELWREQLTITEKYIEENQVYKLMHAKNITGFFSIVLHENNVAEIDYLFIYPKYIGFGYGKMLIEACIQKSMELNATKIIVDVDPHAESFYKYFGFNTYNLLESSIKNRFLPQMELYIKE